MATVNLIQLKRSSSTDAPTSLANGELAFSFTDAANSLYIGDPRNATPGTPLRIAGGKYGFLHSATLSSGEGGTLTANSVMITNANNYIDNIKVNNLVVSTDGAVSPPTITSIQNDGALTAASNSQLATAWAVTKFVTDRIQSQVTSNTSANAQMLVYNTDDAAYINRDITGDISIGTDGTVAITANSIVDADVNDSAAIAYSKLDLTTSIVDGDVSTTADITRTKLATGTADYVLINDGTGEFSEEAQLARSRGGTGIDTDTLANGQILIGGTGGFQLGTLTATTNETTITNTNNAIQIGLPDDVTITANLAANNISVTNDLTVSGNLTVEGTLTTIDTQNLTIEDPMIQVGRNNNLANGALDTIDQGVYGSYANATTTMYTGIFRDADDGGTWKFFESLTVQPGSTVDTADASFSLATLEANFKTSDVEITGGSITGIANLAVADGGTGLDTITAGGILYGNTTGPLGVTAAGANGDVLQVTAGVPAFGTLDGGTF